MQNLEYYTKNRLSNKNQINYDKFEKFISDTIPINENRQYKLGYEVFGMLLLGFCKWIHDECKKNKIKKIFFLSRDGYIVKEAYEKLYPNSDIKYLHVSRKSMVLPSIEDYSIDSIIDSLILPPSFTIEDILNQLGIDSKTINNYDLSKIYYRTRLKEYKELYEIIKQNKNGIIKNIQDQEKNFLQYLKQEKFYGNIAIIDIGWHNSIQNYFLKIINKFDIDVKINGYYLGIYDDAKIIKEPHKAMGYLYEYGNNLNRQYQTFGFVSLLELMFLKNEGTTLGYYVKNKDIVPKLGNYTNDNKVILDFQFGAIEFINNFVENKIDINMINETIAIQNLINFGLNPKDEDIDLFGNIIFENFSYNHMINFKHSSIYYYFHLKTATKDFYKSGWRIIFLKKLLPFPFPHFLLFKLMCKIFI